MTDDETANPASAPQRPQTQTLTPTLTQTASSTPVPPTVTSTTTVTPSLTPSPSLTFTPSPTPVYAIVDAAEGPLPGTRFVVQKALQLDLKPIVLIKILEAGLIHHPAYRIKNRQMEVGYGGR